MSSSFIGFTREGIPLSTFDNQFMPIHKGPHNPDGPNVIRVMIMQCCGFRRRYVPGCYTLAISEALPEDLQMMEWWYQSAEERIPLPPDKTTYSLCSQKSWFKISADTELEYGVNPSKNRSRDEPGRVNRELSHFSHGKGEGDEEEDE
ncbi:hypothetical protein LguiB_026800 [Lonicera macranthoides]